MTTLNQTWMENFQTYVTEISDPRTKDWPLVGNPSLLLMSIFAYLYFVCVYGPNYMKNRKPHDLKEVITVYNIGQISACIYLIQRLLYCGWWEEYSLGCQPVDHAFDGKPYEMAKLVWWTMILKLTEFAETVFFVLRKKGNQISSLHLYHHVSTLIIAWMCCRFTPGGMATFPILINSFVHVIMYTYYLIALHGGRELQKKLTRFKKIITTMQMGQFILLVLHSLSALRADCNVPNTVVYIFAPNIFLLYYLFYDFYKKAYNKQK